MGVIALRIPQMQSPWKSMKMEASLINDLMYIRRAMLKSLQKNEEENDALKEQILALEYHLNKLQST